MTRGPDDAITPSLEQLKALTHPVRVRMLGMLRLDGPATATTLATRLGLNTGATSYHLRQLAQHGFIVDDDSRGDRRERWWKAAHSSTHAQKEGLSDDASSREVLDAYLHSVALTYTQLLQQAIAERALLPKQWRDASTFSDWTARLTPAQAESFKQRLIALLEEMEDDPEGEIFTFQVNAYPWPGRVAVDPESVPDDEGGA